MKIIITLISTLMLLVGTAFAEDATWQSFTLKPPKNDIALTFDDGPDPTYTPQILDTLKKYNVHATFFVMGQFAKRYPDLIKRMVAEGHVVENHTMTHPMLTKVNTKTMQTEIANTNKVVFNIIGTTPKCFRPPYGKHNKQIDSYAHSLNLAVLTWDLNSFDYDMKGVDTLTNWVLSQSKPGYVILMHDSKSGAQTAKALPAIIEGFQKKGLGFSSICA